MTMELRFIERQVPAPEYGENITKPVKILQYRSQCLCINDGGQYMGYTDWQDVPLVRGE